MTLRFTQRRRFGRHGLVAICLLVLASGALAGHSEAQDPETLIRKGIEHRRADRNVEALNLFQQAYELQGTPRALAQIGLAEQALGRWGAADRHLRKAIESTDDPWIRKNRAAVDSALKVIGGHVGRLDVTGAPAGAEVRVDRELIGRLPLSAPVSVTAGGVAIEVRAAGYLPILRAATVPVGVLVRESFDLQSLSPVTEPAPQMAPPSGSGASPGGAVLGSTSTRPITKRSGGDATDGRNGPAHSSVGSENPAEGSSGISSGASPHGAPSNHSGSVRRFVTWGVAGLAAAVLALGVVEHVTWQKKVSSFEHVIGCDANLGTRGGVDCEKLYNDGESAKKSAFVGYGLGAGLVVTAAILYFTDPSRASEPGKLACAVNPLTPGIGCAVRF